MKQAIITIFALVCRCGADVATNCSSTEEWLTGTDGYLTEKNITCTNSRYILPNIHSHDADGIEITYKCIPQHRWWGGRFVFLTLPKGKQVCTNRWNSSLLSGCFLYMKQGSSDKSKSTLEHNKCSIVYISDIDFLFISSWKTKFITFRIVYKLLQCKGHVETTAISKPTIRSTSLRIHQQSNSTSTESSLLPTSATDGQTKPQESLSMASVQIPLAVVATVIVVAFLSTLGYALRRKRMQAKSKHIDSTTHNRIRRYAETSTVTTSTGNPETSNAQHYIAPPNEKAYIQPATVPLSNALLPDKGNTRDEHKYMNQRSGQSASFHHYEQVGQAGTSSTVGYLKPIKRDFVDTESGYQVPIPDDHGYLELNFESKI